MKKSINEELYEEYNKLQESMSILTQKSKKEVIIIKYILA